LRRLSRAEHCALASPAGKTAPTTPSIATRWNIRRGHCVEGRGRTPMETRSSCLWPTATSWSRSATCQDAARDQISCVKRFTPPLRYLREREPGGYDFLSRSPKPRSRTERPQRR
jgi:hypothetical protein